MYKYGASSFKCDYFEFKVKNMKQKKQEYQLREKNFEILNMIQNYLTDELEVLKIVMNTFTQAYYILSSKTLLNHEKHIFIGKIKFKINIFYIILIIFKNLKRISYRSC